MGGGRPVLPSWQNGHPYRPVAGSVKSFQAGIADWGVKRPFNAPFLIHKALVRIRSTDTNLMTNDLQAPPGGCRIPTSGLFVHNQAKYAHVRHF
jgi:hypothetical protein